jgi:hypothetical protein
MELIQSFIAISEAAAKQQAGKKNVVSTVDTHQQSQSQESAAVAAVSLFEVGCQTSHRQLTGDIKSV